MGPIAKGFLGNDISMWGGERMPVLAPAPSLGVSLVHGVIARGRRCWPAGRTRASSASLAPRVHPDYTYRSCSRAGRY